jgi:uncharacterized protein (TIGR00725 family)
MESAVSLIIVGVMGPGEGATNEETRLAHDLGGLIAKQGWVLLTGGREVGVMDAACRGAKAARGTVVAILPGRNAEGVSAAVDIPIITGMHEARNNINVLSSKLLFFIGMSAGTASELALAIKADRPAILIHQREDVVRIFGAMTSAKLETAADALSAVEMAKRILAHNAKTQTPESS